MKTDELRFFFGTKSCPSRYDQMNYKNLLINIMRAYFFEEDMHDFLQAFQNKFSKTLAVPTIRLVLKEIDDAGIFCIRNTKKRIQNVRVKIHSTNDIAETIFTIPHEVKHSQQAYNLHKFCEYNVVPNDDLGKAILISDILCEFNERLVGQTDYYLRLDELDAFTFEVNELHKIMKKYPIYDNPDFNMYIRSRMFSLLYNTKYNREGINNPRIKEAMKTLQEQICDGVRGKYGNDCKHAILDVLKTGFNLENAYLSITNNFDNYLSFLLLENQTFNRLGATNIHLFTNGMPNYAPEGTYSPHENVIDDENIDENSEYGQFIKKYACGDGGEFDKTFDGFVEEIRNSITNL